MNKRGTPLAENRGNPRPLWKDYPRFLTKGVPLLFKWGYPLRANAPTRSSSRRPSSALCVCTCGGPRARVRKSTKSAHDRGSVRPKSVHDLQADPCHGRRSAAVAGRSSPWVGIIGVRGDGDRPNARIFLRFRIPWGLPHARRRRGESCSWPTALSARTRTDGREALFRSCRRKMTMPATPEP